MNIDSLSKSPNGFPNYTLPGILHWLQLNYNKHEKDSLLWNLQKLEFESKLSSLSSENKQLHFIINDQNKRIKMLELQLKLERYEENSNFSLISHSQKNGELYPMHDINDIPPDIILQDVHSIEKDVKSYGKWRAKELIQSFLEEANDLSAFVQSSPQLTQLKQSSSQEKPIQEKYSTQDRHSDKNKPTLIRRDPTEDSLIHTQDLSTILSSTSLKDSLEPRYKFPSFFSLNSHLDSIRCLHWHPNKLSLFSSSEDGTIKMWNIQNLLNLNRIPTDVDPIYTFRGHSAPVTCLEIINVGKKYLLCSGSLDSTIRTWNIPSPDRDSFSSFVKDIHGIKSGLLIGHSDSIWKLSAKHDILASASSDLTVKIWKVEEFGEARLKTCLRGSHVPICLVWFNDDLLVGYDDGSLILWNISNVEPIKQFNHSERINEIKLHPNVDNLVIFVDSLGFITFFDLSIFEIITTFKGHESEISDLDIWYNGQLFITSSHDNDVIIWNTSTRTKVGVVKRGEKRLNQGIWNVKFFPEGFKKGPYFVFAGSDGIVYGHRGE